MYIRIIMTLKLGKSRKVEGGEKVTWLKKNLRRRQTKRGGEAGPAR
jgi:hypothetical protein